jgi:hypothetical protein
MYRHRLVRACAAAALAAFALAAHATFHLWQISELYSSADGKVQFIELAALAGGQQFLGGQTITASQGATSHAFTFPSDLPADTTGRRFLIGTQSMANLGVVAPDFVVPDGFLLLPNGTVNYAGVDSVTYASLPTDGVHSLTRTGAVIVNSPTNFAGQAGTINGAALPPPAMSAPIDIPTLGEKATILLASLIGLAGMLAARRFAR